jgi:hypothetical protein
MMKVRFTTTLAIVSFAAALSGCVSYGNTHALITPVGGIGYHSFKPSDTARDIRLPEQRNPDRIAANKAAQEQQEQEDET